MDTKEEPDRFLTTTEVAARLAISVRTLMKLVDGGDFLQPIRIGRSLKRWKSSEVEAWVKNQRPRTEA